MDEVKTNVKCALNIESVSKSKPNFHEKGNRTIYTDNSARLTLGPVSHHIVNSLIVIMCTLMCTASWEKVQSASSHTEKTEWGYETKNGPDVWAQLSSEYVLCAEGRNQSPIDLVNPISAKLPAIAYEYHQTTDLNIRNLAVVGLLIENGRRNFTFDPVWHHLPAVPGKTQRVEVSEKHPVNPVLFTSR